MSFSERYRQIRQQHPGYQRIRDLSDPKFLLLVWGAAFLFDVAAATWFGWQSSGVVQEYFEWFLAIALAMLPALVALSIAGPVASRIQNRGYYRLALLLFTILLVAVGFGGTFVMDRQPFTQQIDEKRAEVRKLILSN